MWPTIQTPNATGNHTYDILTFGCWNKFETVACIRNGILAGLALITAVLCIFKVVRLHLRRHQTCHQYLIFYCASLECCIGSIHWSLSSVPQLDFVLQYLKLLQFVVMGHFYWTLATRALRKEKLAERFILPFLVLMGVYFTVISILGVINTQTTWIECLQPYWIELSSVELVIVQLFAVSGFYITRRLNEISTLDSVRWSQKRDLWCIIIVFELSAFTTFVYDLAIQIAGDKYTGCSAIFLHNQTLYTPIFVIFTILKLLLPIWVMLFVFVPTPPQGDRDDLLPALSDEGTFPSGYSGGYSSYSEDQQYRQLYHPDYNSINSPGHNPLSPGAAPRSVLVRQTRGGWGSSSLLEDISEERPSATGAIPAPDPRGNNKVVV